MAGWGWGRGGYGAGGMAGRGGEAGAGCRGVRETRPVTTADPARPAVPLGPPPGPPLGPPPGPPLDLSLDLPPAAQAAGLRLVAVDMDGTLLDSDHEVDAGFWPLLPELRRRGIVVCPASGRQYATLERQFADADVELVYIAENGTQVVLDGRTESTDLLDLSVAHDVVTTVRTLAARGVPAGAVLCGTRSAYIERADPWFVAEADRYYARLEVVEDLLAVQDDVLKVAVYDDGVAQETTLPALVHLRPARQVVVSGAHWVDVMSSTADKGSGLRRVQELLGITPEQTAAFGDYLNDTQMLTAAGMSFAMANAHPDVLAVARHRAPSNDERGVSRTLAALLGLAG